MKIVLGISGFGNGHSSRQTPILEKLLGAGHDIIVVGHDNSYHHVRRVFPQVPILQVKVPALIPQPDGIDFRQSAQDTRNHTLDIYPTLYQSIYEVETTFGRPDVVISDYEMVSAQIAYALDAPLITLDQHSKFLGYRFPRMGDFTPEEHRIRLRMFFPKAHARIATSFYRVDLEPVPDYLVELIPPILRSEVARLQSHVSESDNFLVYLSSVSDTAQSMAEIVTFLKTYPKLRFTVFSNKQPEGVDGNVICRHFDQQVFLSALYQARGVIATAGHNIITECIYLRKPMYLMPFANYDQIYTASVVADERIGLVAKRLDAESFELFLDNLDTYSSNMDRSPRLFQRFDGDAVFVEMLHGMGF